MLKANTSTNKGQPLTHPKDMRGWVGGKFSAFSE